MNSFILRHVSSRQRKMLMTVLGWGKWRFPMNYPWMDLISEKTTSD